MRVAGLSIAAGAAYMVGLGAAAAATATPVQPSGGYYEVSGITTGTSAGCTSDNKVGDTNQGVFYYPGPLTTGASYRSIKPGYVTGTAANPVVNTPAISVIALSATPAAGAKTWKGTYNSTQYPLKAGQKPSTGTFSATIGYAVAGAFFLTITHLEGTCSVTETWGLVRVGYAGPAGIAP